VSGARDGRAQRRARVRLGLLGGEEGVERDLGVDDHELAARQAHENVWTQAAVVGVHRGLGSEVAVLDHAGHLDDVAQLDLAPRAAGRRASQRRAEAPGLLGQTVHAGQQRAQRLAEASVGLAALLLELVDLALHLAELEPDRLDDALDLLGALAELPGRPLLVSQALRGVLAREVLAGFAQDVGRYGLDVAAQLLAVAAHQLNPRVGRRELNPVLFGVGREALLHARDLGIVALDQRPQLDLMHRGAARELGLACREVDAVATHEHPDAGRAQRDSQDKEDKTHRHHRLPTRERSTVAPPPDAMHAVRHDFIPWVAPGRRRLTAHPEWRAIGTPSCPRFPWAARTDLA
jgi:hypothetical protein